MSEKKMTFWQRVENFWYYYKWRVIVVIIVAFAVYLSAQVLCDNKAEPGDLNIVSLLAHPLTSEEYDVDKRLKEFVADVDKDGEKTVVLEQFYVTEKRTQDDMIAKSQLDAKLSKASGDLLIFDELNLEEYLKKDIFEPLENYVDISQIPEGDIIKRNGVAVLVKLTESKMLQDMNFIVDEVYAGVMFIPDDAEEVTLKTRENTKIAIEKLLEK